jgi:hypothetical protein
MPKESDKNRVILAQLVARMWRDPAFRDTVKRDPRKALTEAGVSVPPTVHIRVLENTDKVTHIVLPPQSVISASPGILQKIMERALPIPPGTEVNLVQDNDSVKSLVIPRIPPGYSAGQLTDEQLAGVAGGGYQTLNAYTTANATAEVNVAGVQNVGGATEAVVVAVGAAVLV